MQNIKTTMQIGKNGFTQAVLEELKLQLKKHKLIKVKITPTMREKRDELIETVLQHTGAELVKRVGNTFVLRKVSGKDL